MSQPNITEIEVYLLQPASAEMRASHPRVTHYARSHKLPVPDPRVLAGQVVRIDKGTFQVLGLQLTSGDAAGLALRKVIKVGRG